MISWTPEGGDNSRWQLSKIINGTHDAYIRQFATDAKNWGYPFFLRIMHEMNGSWGYPWQETQNGNKRGEFVQAWRHIVDIFRQVGVQNASYRVVPQHRLSRTPPNPTVRTRSTRATRTWTGPASTATTGARIARRAGRRFDKVYNYSYNEILKFAPAKPMMIGEFGSVEQGGVEGQLVHRCARRRRYRTSYKQIRAAAVLRLGVRRGRLAHRDERVGSGRVAPGHCFPVLRRQPVRLDHGTDCRAVNRRRRSTPTRGQPAKRPEDRVLLLATRPRELPLPSARNPWNISRSPAVARKTKYTSQYTGQPGCCDDAQAGSNDWRLQRGLQRIEHGDCGQHGRRARAARHRGASAPQLTSQLLACV